MNTFKIYHNLFFLLVLNLLDSSHGHSLPNDLKDESLSLIKPLPLRVFQEPRRFMKLHQPQDGIHSHVDGLNDSYLALTFDDGPGNHTMRLLDILKARHIKATFFLVGVNVVAHANHIPTDMGNIVRRILAEGHEIGDHSWDHGHLQMQTDEEIISNIKRCRDAIQKDTHGNAKIRLFRPPYGEFTIEQAKMVTKRLKMQVIKWDVDPEDWNTPGVEVVTRIVLDGAHTGAIILMHDVFKETVDAVPGILDGLLERGFKMVTVSQLLALGEPGRRP